MKVKSLIALAASMVLFTTTAFAATTKKEEPVKEPQILTFDEAVTKALKNNTSIKNLSDNVELMEDNKEKTFQQFSQTTGETVWPGGGRQLVSDNSLSFLSSLDSLDAGIKSSRYQQQILEESTEMVVKNYFIDIKNNEKDLDLVKKSLELQQKLYNEALIKQEVGMISDMDVKKLANELEQAKHNQELLELTIQSQYINFYKLIGAKEDEKYILEYDVKFEPINIGKDLTLYINKKIKEDPSMLARETELDSAKFSLDTYSYSQAESYKSRETSLKTKVRSYEDTVKEMEAAIKSTYKSLEQLETKQKTLELNLKNAQDEYKKAEVNYEVGNITKTALDTAALGIESVETDIQKNILNYDKLKFTFEHPYMLVSSGQ